MYLFGGDYGYKKEEDVRDQHINELSAGSLRDDNMDCDIFKKDDMLLFGEEQSIKKGEDVETIVIRSEFRLFGAHNIDRDGYIPSNEQVSVVCTPPNKYIISPSFQPLSHTSTSLSTFTTDSPLFSLSFSLISTSSSLATPLSSFLSSPIIIINTSFLHLSSHCLLHLRHYQPLLPILLYFLFLSL